MGAVKDAGSITRRQAHNGDAPTAGVNRRLAAPFGLPFTLPLPLLPERLRMRRRPKLWQEILFILVSYWIYSLVRNGVTGREVAAFRRAHEILHLESILHINFERSLNHLLDQHAWLAIGADYYYATLHFVLVITVLAWVYTRFPLRYRAIRTVLYCTTLVAIIGFWTYALAPPRMLHGYIDTVVKYGTWGSWGSGDVAKISNQFAAMPSLHIGWSTWCGITIVMLARRWWVKVLGALYPVVTLLVIIGTANHYVLDAVGGLGVLACGYGIQFLLTGHRTYALPTPALVYEGGGEPMGPGRAPVTELPAAAATSTVRVLPAKTLQPPGPSVPAEPLRSPQPVASAAATAATAAAAPAPAIAPHRLGQRPPFERAGSHMIPHAPSHAPHRPAEPLAPGNLGPPGPHQPPLEAGPLFDSGAYPPA